MSQTLQLDLPDEASEIEGLKESLERFVARQIAYRQWRQERYAPKIRNLTDRILERGQQMQRNGFDRSEEQRELRSLLDSLSHQPDSK